MSYKSDLIIENNNYSVVFDDNNKIDGYQSIIFLLNGSCCGRWSDFNTEIIEKLCQSVIDYIIKNSIDKFCFYSINSDIYNFYKQFELNIPQEQKSLYSCREEYLKNPYIRDIKISFYDRI
jgi:hypothetical protein